MPFQSEKQRRFLHANHPEIAKRWERDYAGGGITRLGYRFGGNPHEATQGSAGAGQSSGGGGQGSDYGQFARAVARTINNPPPVTTGGESPFAYTKPPVKDKKEDSSGFLIDVRKKNRKKYLDLLRKYKPDDFDIKNIIRRKSKLSEEETKFIEPYGTRIWEDMAKTVPEKFFNLYETGVAPKVDPTKIISPRQYEWAQADYDFSEIEGQRADISKPDIKAFLDNSAMFENLDDDTVATIISDKTGNKTLTSQDVGIIRKYKEKTKPTGKFRIVTAKGGVARKNYFHGGILGLNESEEIISDDGNDIELTAYNAAFDDPNDLSTGVRTLFQAKDGGTPQLAKKSKDGKRPGYGGPHETYGGGVEAGRDPSPPDYSGGDGYQDRIIEVQERTRKQDLKDLVATGPGSDVEKYDTDLVGMTDNQKYKARKNAILSKYTGRSSQRKNALTTNYQTEKARLEKKLKGSLLLKGLMLVMGMPVGIKDFVSVDWKNKSLKGPLKTAMTLDQLKKDHIKSLTDIKESFLVDVDINNPNEMANLDDTAFPDVMKELKELTKPREEDDPGPHDPVLPPQLGGPSTEEMATEYRMSNLERIRAGQALRERINPDWELTAEAKELKNNPIVSGTETDIIALGNSGGLANLFRVKNQY